MSWPPEHVKNGSTQCLLSFMSNIDFFSGRFRNVILYRIYQYLISHQKKSSGLPRKHNIFSCVLSHLNNRSRKVIYLLNRPWRVTSRTTTSYRIGRESIILEHLKVKSLKVYYWVIIHHIISLNVDSTYSRPVLYDVVVLDDILQGRSRVKSIDNRFKSILSG